MAESVSPAQPHPSTQTTEPPAASLQPQSSVLKPNKKRRRKPSTSKPISKTNANTNPDRKTKSHTLTLRNPSYAYIHLTYLPPFPQSTPLDALTTHIHITSALTQHLGLHGAAIAFDILKLSENEKERGREVWIRVQTADRAAIVAAVGGWRGGKGEGWAVTGWGFWDAEVGRRGQDLFS